MAKEVDSPSIHFSFMVVIGSEIGSEYPQAFLIHKHLLALHSKYFSNLFREFHEPAKREASGILEGSDSRSESVLATSSVEDKDKITNEDTDGNLEVEDPDNELEDVQNESPDEDEKTGMKFKLPQFNAYIFADFYSLLYSGRLLEARSLQHEISGEQLTALGEFLEAPALQNLCMEGNIIHYRDDEQYDHWILVKCIESVYDVTRKGSLLRKLVADLLNLLNPIGKVRGPKLKKWKALLIKCPDIKNDV
ncbi:hypothetical protein BDZ45DRAFT_691024 [Acephala macrosclerotiorum]|nr:hypothetical protein BDZ45DRAFT_691024 [Acephala macrosclerotiorum]